MTEKADIIVIGAGVVGAAVAYELAAAGRAPIVLEAGPRIAEGVTSRNSGVVHAGLYYTPGSLKAESCIRGNALLYEWCAARGVEYRKTGKWVVGTAKEEAALVAMHENALKCGARGLSLKKRPAIDGVSCDVAVFSSETGIVDAAAYAFSFEKAAEEKGAMFLTGARVEGIEPLPGQGYLVRSTRGEIEAERIVNAAGLYADEVASMAGIAKYRIHPCRGDYFKLSGGHRFETLVYPVKKKGAAGLGVHLTVALDGSCRLGPDAYYVDRKDQFGDPEDLESKRKSFFELASQYLCNVTIEQISYDSCGIRPKLRGPNDAEEADFVLSEDVSGFLNLVGIESPGLTASRDLAQRVARRFS